MNSRIKKITITVNPARPEDQNIRCDLETGMPILGLEEWKCTATLNNETQIYFAELRDPRVQSEVEYLDHFFTASRLAIKRWLEQNYETT